MARSSNALRFFTVGETVHLRSRVSLPGSRTPTDPDTVSLTSVKRDGTEVLTGPLAFTREREGEYALSLQTGTYTPGNYRVVVVHADGPERVTIATDEFVLVAL